MCFMPPEDTDNRRSAETVWDAEAYAANTAHHRAHDDAFLSTTPLSPTMTVVDVGCGSGDFTRVVAELVAEGEVVGVDPSAELVELAARSARLNQRFLVGTAQNLATLIQASSVDGVVSRAALHWVPPHDHPP